MKNNFSKEIYQETKNYNTTLSIINLINSYKSGSIKSPDILKAFFEVNQIKKETREKIFKELNL
jgi:hypothetical protein